MKIAEILVAKGYKFYGKKMWMIAIDKAMNEHKYEKPKEDATQTRKEVV